MTFMKAYEEMKKGRILRRKSVPHVLFRRVGAVIQANISGDPKYPWTTAYTLCVLFDDTDWEICENDPQIREK